MSLNWSELVEEEILTTLGDKDIKRQEMIHELVQTERTFVHYLKILKTEFQERLEEEGIISIDESKVLFCNLSCVLAMNGMC